MAAAALAVVAVATLPGCVLGGGLPDVVTPLIAADADSVACGEPVGRRDGGGAEGPRTHGQARHLTQTTRPGAAAAALVIPEVVVVVEPDFRAAHDAHGGLGCVVQKGFAAGRIGLAVIRYRAVTAMAGVGGGKRGEQVLQPHAALGSCLVGLEDR